ncbi:MAG: hypothetical protein KAR22_11235, partial [Gammaproteobacteria bacterium]|nr:hypothetical protein [Gammaproteobacteria bacterium]
GFSAGIALAGAQSLRRRGLTYLVVIYCFGFGLIALAAAPNFATILAAVLAIAALATASDVLTQSMMQLSVPDRLRGRAMGAWVFAIGAAPLGHLEMGALAASFGVGTALGLNGIGLILIAILTTIIAPGLRKL